MLNVLKYVAFAATAAAMAVGCQDRGDGNGTDVEPIEPAVRQPPRPQSSRQLFPDDNSAPVPMRTELRTEDAERHEGQEPRDGAADPQIETQSEKANYAIGFQFGRNLMLQGVEIHPEVIARALSDALEGEPSISMEEQQSALMALEQDLQERMAARAGENLERSQRFLERNGQREGVETTGSGLQYEIMEEGDGKQPTAGDVVTVHYRGMLVDGQEVDSSYTLGEPVTLPVIQFIPGLAEGIQLMSEGAKWRLYIPPDLAYGEMGAGGVIGPNEVLVFEVELIEVAKSSQMPSPPEEG